MTSLRKNAPCKSGGPVLGYIRLYRKKRTDTGETKSKEQDTLFLNQAWHSKQGHQIMGVNYQQKKELRWTKHEKF